MIFARRLLDGKETIRHTQEECVHQSEQQDEELRNAEHQHSPIVVPLTDNARNRKRHRCHHTPDQYPLDQLTRATPPGLKSKHPARGILRDELLSGRSRLPCDLVGSINRRR